MPTLEDSDPVSGAERLGDVRAFETEVAREAVRQALFGQAMPRAVGRYRIERRCGRGAMGAVFEAHDPELERPVALKLLERRGAPADALERLERQVLHEARAMARLHHPAVAAVYEVGRHGTWVFLAMELMAGPSLREWLHGEQPSWRRIVGAFCDVGRGLAAAHDAGLAHGDFKPENLRFDDNGRLRILDFGLAGSISAAVPATAVRAGSSSAALLLSTGIEGFGGTPAYAAPERIDGAPADERSDQFSFFVALYESLYGRRPFTGTSLEQLRRSIARGPGKPGTAIPGPKSLRSAIERGLSEEPTRRFESMTEAVAALEHAAARRPLRWWLLGGVTLAAGVGGWSLARNHDEPCPDPDALFESVWDDKRLAISRARPSDLADAPPWSRLEPALDDYARGWADAVASVCRSDEMKNHPDRGARYLVCLQQRRAGFERLLQRLTRGEARTWASALEAVAELPGLDECDGVQLPGILPPPPELEPLVDELRESIVVARVDADGGDLDKALDTMRELVSRARTLGYAPVLAETLMAEGKLLADLDHLEDASDRLRSAHGEALAGGHVQVATDTAIALVYVDGYQRARHEIGHHWAWVARQFLREREQEPSSLISNEAALFFEEGRLEEADDGFRKAIAAERSKVRSDPFVLDGLRHNRGAVAVRRGDYAAAVEIHTEVLEARRRIYGDHHAKVAKALSSLAGAERGLGRLEDAMAHELEALRRLERIHGLHSPALRLVLVGLAQIQIDAGQPERGAETLVRLLDILQRHLEPDHPWLADVTQQLAIAELSRCRYDQAERHFETVLASMSARTDQRDMLALVRHNLAELRLWQGRHAEVRELTEAAAAHWTEERELEQSYPRTALGIAAVEQGAYEEGREILQRQLEVRERRTGPSSTLTAEASAGLGRALVGLGRGDEGIAALQRALAVYDSEDPYGRDRPARMRAAEWLAHALDATRGRTSAAESRRLLDEARRFWIACGDDRAAARVEARLASPR